MYVDHLVIFWQREGTVHASVYERRFPAGRQRRMQVAKYTLGPADALPGPHALLAALDEAMTQIPDYVIT